MKYLEYLLFGLVVFLPLPTIMVFVPLYDKHHASPVWTEKGTVSNVNGESRRPYATIYARGQFWTVTGEESKILNLKAGDNVVIQLVRGPFRYAACQLVD